MIKRWFGGVTIVGCAGLLCLPHLAKAQQAPRGDWSMTGNTADQSGWQKNERKLTPETASSKFQFLWKINLGAPAKASQTYGEPLLISRTINAQGFKDFVYVTSSDTLYAVDSELGNLLWKKEYALAKNACGGSSVHIIMEPPAVINFNARRAPGAPPPPQAPPLEPNERRIGIAAGGGGFGLKGVYALTSDGMLHEQVVTTGVDFAPPIKFLPAAAGASALNITGKTIYAATPMACGSVPAGVWAVNMTSADYPVAHYDMPKGASLASTGPVLGADGTAYVVTGAGATTSADFHANSVVALGSDLKVKDWYTPSGVESTINPIVFSYKGKQLVAATGKGGASLVLLDAASLGGADHHTPLSETPALTKTAVKHGWDSLATWQETDGTTWVIASISAPVSTESLKGMAAHGAIVGFRVDDADGKPVLTPAWISEDMVNPAPPRIANGVIVALAGGNPATHARLFVLDAKTGKELYSSKDTIPTYANRSGVAVGDSHAFFTDHDNVLYSFGIALEH